MVTEEFPGRKEHRRMKFQENVDQQKNVNWEEIEPTGKGGTWETRGFIRRTPFW